MYDSFNVSRSSLCAWMKRVASNIERVIFSRRYPCKCTFSETSRSAPLSMYLISIKKIIIIKNNLKKRDARWDSNPRPRIKQRDLHKNMLSWPFDWSLVYSVNPRQQCSLVNVIPPEGGKKQKEKRKQHKILKVYVSGKCVASKWVLSYGDAEELHLRPAVELA